MSLVVITPPDPLVELDLAKRHLRVDWDTDDDLIASYIASASAAVDGPFGCLQRAVGEQTLELRLEGFDPSDWRRGDGYAWSGGWAGDGWRSWPFGRIVLRCPPLISIVSVTYEDGSGVDQVLSATGWTLEGDGVEPAFGQSWPSGRVAANAVRIRYTAGYDSTPPTIRQAVLLMIADYWANREGQLIGDRAAVVENPAVQSLLSGYRVWC